MIYELVLSKSEAKADEQIVWLGQTYGPTLSPGGVAAYLGLPRQTIHNAIRRDMLDKIRIVRADGELVAVLIPFASVQRYKALREAGNGRVPMYTGTNIPPKPQRISPAASAA